jgi:hypothetical protein
VAQDANVCRKKGGGGTEGKLEEDTSVAKGINFSGQNRSEIFGRTMVLAKVKNKMSSYDFLPQLKILLNLKKSHFCSPISLFGKSKN